MSEKSPMPQDSRFVFRLFTEEDLPDLRELYDHPESYRYMKADGSPWSDEDLLRAVRTWRDEFATFGYTKWRVDTVDGTFVGRAGISPLEGNPAEAELGYCVMRREWGKGYATQLAMIVRDWTWLNTDLPYLIGVTRQGNMASQKVLRKIGMVDTGSREFQGSVCDFFRLDLAPGGRPMIISANDEAYRPS